MRGGSPRLGFVQPALPFPLSVAAHPTTAAAQQAGAGARQGFRPPRRRRRPPGVQDVVQERSGQLRQQPRECGLQVLVQCGRLNPTEEQIDC